MPARHLSDDELLDLSSNLASLDGASRSHLRGCGECERRFRRFVADFELARGSRGSVEVRAGATGSRLPRRAVLYSLAAVAAALLLIAVLLRQGGHARPDDGLDYWLPDDFASEWRSAPVGGDESIALQALEAYRSEDTSRVVKLLADWPFSKGGSYEHLHIVLASAFVWQGELDAALEQLDVVRAHTLPQPYRDRAQWIRYVALRRGGHADEARALARDLAGREGEFQDRAAALLRQP